MQITRREVKIVDGGVVVLLKLDRKESINFTLRMSVDTRLELEKIAANESRTVTNVINLAIKRYIEMYNGDAKK